MTIKETFIAFDGTEFETDIECLKYETDKYVECYGSILRAYDEDGKQLSLGDISTLVRDAYFIICDTDEAAEFISIKIEEYGYCSEDIDGAGRYYCLGDCWATLSYATNMRDNYNRIIDILEEK